MNSYTKPFILAALIMAIAACSSSKKTSSPLAPLPPTTTTNNTPPLPAPLPGTNVAKAENGVYEPGEAELAEAKLRDQNSTADQLNEGYVLYSKGACVNCHKAKNIYRFSEAKWKEIVADMGDRARISAAQKNAVYQYVLAIKAVKARENK